MDVGFTQGDGYLVAKLSGRYSLDGMMRAIDRMGERVRELQVKRLLVDVSDLEGEASLSDRYVYGSYAAVGLRGVWKCAAFAGPTQPVVPLTALAARGKGLQLEVFRDRADAVAWLLDK